MRFLTWIVHCSTPLSARMSHARRRTSSYTPSCVRTNSVSFRSVSFRFVSFRFVSFQTETSRFKNQPFQKLLLLCYQV